MKQPSFEQLSLNGIQELHPDEIRTIDGGNFWEELAYRAGVMVRCYYEFVTQASSYQSSLPPTLKK